MIEMAGFAGSWEELYRKYGIKQKGRHVYKILAVTAAAAILGVFIWTGFIQQDKIGISNITKGSSEIGIIINKQPGEGISSAKPICSSDYACNDNNASTSDICKSAGTNLSYCFNSLKRCQEQGRLVCSLDEKCDGSWTSSADSTRCCSSTCTKLQCSDNTFYGKCSASKPVYCNSGALVSNCLVCGCAGEQSCKTFGDCSAAALNFSLSADYLNGSIKQGEAISATVSLVLTGENAQTIYFSATNLPIASAATFNPESCNSNCTSNMTVSTLAATPAGIYPLIVVGTSEGFLKTLNYNLSVKPLCAEDWACGNWSVCNNSMQSRDCADRNSCGTYFYKPNETQSCADCIESWTCASWSACANSQQARACTDNNACGTNASKPAETQSCVPDTDGDGDPDTTDCAPADAARHHGAAEICDNGMDDNCDGADSDCPTPYNIKVLDLSYIPTISGKVDISKTGDWQNENINALINNIDSLRNGLVSTLNVGSTYHSYKDPYAARSLDYEILEKKIFYAPVPPSPTYRGMDNAPSADHMKILNDLNICDYVENKGVKEVWVWMYHTQQVAPIESNMAGPYGDISNSYRENDLPVCKKTYTVFDYNYGRSYSMAVEDHTHQIEAILNYIDGNLFWKLFVGTNDGGGRCGWTHYPPNGRYDYDWNNENNVSSDCEDWKPDGSGQKKQASCRTWSSNPSACDNDEGLSFKRWWMQNIPGINSNLFYNGKKLRNWWVFIGNFDAAMASKKLTF